MVKKKVKGFTLIELVVVIIIVGILSVVAVPIYRGYTRKAMATEGKTLLGTVQTAEKVYFTEFANFKAVSQTNFDEVLDVDARPNKYFTGFKVSASGNQFTATTSGSFGASGISLTLVSGKTTQPVWIDKGLND